MNSFWVTLSWKKSSPHQPPRELFLKFKKKQSQPQFSKCSKYQACGGKSNQKTFPSTYPVQDIFSIDRSIDGRNLFHSYDILGSIN